MWRIFFMLLVLNIIKVILIRVCLKVLGTLPYGLVLLPINSRYSFLIPIPKKVTSCVCS